MVKTVKIEDEVLALLEKEQAKREVSFSRMVCIALREWVNSQAVEIEEREYICGACYQHQCNKCEQEDTIYSDPAGNMFTLRCVCEVCRQSASPRPIICTEVELEWPENEGDPYKLVRVGGA